VVSQVGCACLCEVSSSVIKSVHIHLYSFNSVESGIYLPCSEDHENTMNFTPYQSRLFYPEYQSVVGVASRTVEAVVASWETAAAARTNPARRRRLTTAGRTGRVSCVRCEKEKTVTSLNPGLLPWPSHSHYNKSISSFDSSFVLPSFPHHLHSSSHTNMHSITKDQLPLHLFQFLIQSVDSWRAISIWSLLRSTSAKLSTAFVIRPCLRRWHSVTFPMQCLTGSLTTLEAMKTVLSAT